MYCHERLWLWWAKLSEGPNQRFNRLWLYRFNTVESLLLRASFSGRTLASQANNVGSIPIARSIVS
jgi:hypothetical protein